MTENSDKSAEMMKFNDEQRDADMQRRISERTSVETDPAAMLTVLVGRLLLERGVECQPPRWRSTCERCSPPLRLPATRRAPPASDSNEQSAPLTRDIGWAGRPAVSFERSTGGVSVLLGVVWPALIRREGQASIWQDGTSTRLSRYARK